MGLEDPEPDGTMIRCWKLQGPPRKYSRKSVEAFKIPIATTLDQVSDHLRGLPIVRALSCYNLTPSSYILGDPIMNWTKAQSDSKRV